MRYKKAFFFIMALVIGSFAAAGIFTSLQPSSAEFVVTSLDIPATAEVEERVTITAYVANTGGKEDTYTATLTVNGGQVEGGGCGIAPVGVEATSNEVGKALCGMTVPQHRYGLEVPARSLVEVEMLDHAFAVGNRGISGG